MHLDRVQDTSVHVALSVVAASIARLLRQIHSHYTELFIEAQMTDDVTAHALAGPETLRPVAGN